MTFLPLAAALIISWGGPALAQHAGHGATPAYGDTLARMHRDMNIPLTGDADRDFAAGMIPHHQGAIEMARAELEHGRDPEMRRMAEEIIVAQEKEIARLQAFLPRGR